jgi:hypothetical protein
MTLTTLHSSFPCIILCRPYMQGIDVPRTLAASDPFAIAILSCTHTYLEHTA